MNANAARLDMSEGGKLFDFRGNSSMGTFPVPKLVVRNSPDSMVPELFSQNATPNFQVGSATGAQRSTFIASIDEKWREDPQMMDEQAAALDPGFLGSGVMNPIKVKPHTF